MPSYVISTSVSGTQIAPPAPAANGQVQVIGFDVTSEDTCEVQFTSNGVVIWETQATGVAGGGVMRPASSGWDMFGQPGYGINIVISPNGVKCSGAVTVANRGA